MHSQLHLSTALLMKMALRLVSSTLRLRSVKRQQPQTLLQFKLQQETSATLVANTLYSLNPFRTRPSTESTHPNSTTRCHLLLLATLEASDHPKL